MSPTETDTMISAAFAIQLPPNLWVTELSRSYPSATFSLLSGYRAGDRARELGEVHANDPQPIVESMAGHAAMTDFERLESADTRTLVKYETTDTALYDFVELSSLTIEFPVDVQNGWYEFDLTGTREELDRLQDVLDSSPLSYELRSLVEGTEPAQILTDRQQTVLETALRKGYFEIPRENGLAAVAAELEVDKSTASTTLRRGQARIIKSFLTGPES